jgi:hypothetical protein
LGSYFLKDYGNAHLQYACHGAAPKTPRPSKDRRQACAGMGLVTRPRMTMDVPAIKKLLKLSDSQVPLLNNPVGYAK